METLFWEKNIASILFIPFIISVSPPKINEVYNKTHLHIQTIFHLVCHKCSDRLSLKSTIIPLLRPSNAAENDFELLQPPMLLCYSDHHFKKLKSPTTMPLLLRFQFQLLHCCDNHFNFNSKICTLISEKN